MTIPAVKKLDVCVYVREHVKKIDLKVKGAGAYSDKRSRDARRIDELFASGYSMLHFLTGLLEGESGTRAHMPHQGRHLYLEALCSPLNWFHRRSVEWDRLDVAERRRSQRNIYAKLG